MSGIPDFQTIMLPIIRLLADGAEHTQDELETTLARDYALNQEQLAERLQSGTQTRWVNRVSWSVTHLTKAGLAERTGRRRMRITDRGRDALAQNPERIDMRFLRQFPEYQQFIGATRKPAAETVASMQPMTPQEQIDESYRALRDALAQDLLDRVKQTSPSFFEHLVVQLLVAMGYGGSLEDAGRVVGRSGDGGIDGIIKEDRLGLDVVHIQAKRWENPVGRPQVQTFAGSLEGHRANKGVMITTSTFTADAREFVERLQKRIVLIDGAQLAAYMIDHGVGVTEFATYRIKRIDLDYFEGN